MFTRHRHGPIDKLDCPHAMGANPFSRIMIPRLPLRLRSGLRQSRDFRQRAQTPARRLNFLLLPWPHSTPSLRSVPQGRLHSTPSLRSVARGRLPCLPRTQADESSSQGGTSHPKIAKSAILGWGHPRRSFRLQVYGYVVMPEHVHLLLSETQRDTSSDRTAPLKPKDGLNGPPVQSH